MKLTAANPARPVTVLAIDRPARSAFPLHTHDHGQLIHAITGVMIVRAEAGDWVVPTGRAVWVPAGTRHTIEAANNIQIRTVFVAPDARAGLPDTCQVLGVGSLLRELIVSAAAFGTDEIPGARAERIMALILDEIEIAPRLSLHVPMPRHPTLAELSRQLLANPAAPASLTEWALRAHMNEKTLARTFKRETGMTHGAWCRHARLLLSLPHLAGGASILEVALAHGYESPSAFAAVFRKHFGAAPSDYFKPVNARTELEGG